MTTNPIRTFTPLHQMTNYIPIPGIPIPQYSQMASHPQIPIQNPLIQYNPLVNPLRDISGRNRTVQDIFNDRQQLRDEAKKRQQEEIEKKIKEHEEKKKQDRSQTLFEVQTKGNFESLPLFSPFATSTADQEEEEDPFFKSVFKNPSPQEVIATFSGYSGFAPSVIEDASKVGNVYLDKHGKKYTYDEYGNKKPVDDSLSPIEEKSEEEDEPPPPKLKKSLSNEEMEEQLGKIKTLSNESKQFVDLIKEHVVPNEPQVSFNKLESKLDDIISRGTSLKPNEGPQKKETLGEWAKRKKEEKQATEEPIEAARVLTPVTSKAMPVAIATEMKGRTDYNKEENIYLKQSDRDRLRALEAKKSNKTISEEEKTEMTNLKAKRRRNKSTGKTYT